MSRSLVLDVTIYYGWHEVRIMHFVIRCEAIATHRLCCAQTEATCMLCWIPFYNAVTELHVGVHRSPIVTDGIGARYFSHCAEFCIWNPSIPSLCLDAIQEPLNKIMNKTLQFLSSQVPTIVYTFSRGCMEDMPDQPTLNILEKPSPRQTFFEQSLHAMGLL